MKAPVPRDVKTFVDPESETSVAETEITAVEQYSDRLKALMETYELVEVKLAWAKAIRLSITISVVGNDDAMCERT